MTDGLHEYGGADRARDEARIGEVLDGKYRLVKLIGRGGMGVVYEAEHTVISRRVAIKMLNPRRAASETAAERFLREAQTASAIGHDSIIDIQDVGRTEAGEVFLVMELLEGESLAALLERRGPLTSEETFEIIRPVLDGLAAAHRAGIIHRDLKPDNIFVVDAEAGDVRILDFGISKVASPDNPKMTLTQTGAILGTPYYMSPEQAEGAKRIDARIDIWAMGVILFEMLTGDLPYTGDSYNAVLARILTRPVPSIRERAAELDDPIASVVERALQKDRAARFASVEQMIAVLDGDVVAPVAVPSSADTAIPPGAPELVTADTLDSDGEIGVVSPFDVMGETVDSLSETPAPDTPRNTPERAPTVGAGSAMDASSSATERAPRKRARPTAVEMPDAADEAATATPGDDEATPAESESETDSDERIPSLEIEGEAPWWKVGLWFALTLPLAWLPTIVAAGSDKELLFGMLGLPGRLAIGWAMLTMVGISVALTVATVLMYRFWRRGHWNRWLQGNAFALIPTLGLGLAVFHYLQLSGQHTAHFQALRSYTAITEAQAASIVEQLQVSHERFLAAAALDVTLVAILSTIVLLGYMFVHPKGARPKRHRRRYLGLLAGFLFVVVAETAIFPFLSRGGFLRFPLYGVWFLSAMAILRIREPHGEGFHMPWQTLRASVIALVALTGVQVTIGLYVLFRRFGRTPLEELPANERELMMTENVRPVLVGTTVIEWIILAVLFGLLVFITQRKFFEGAGRPNPKAVGGLALIVFITAFPMIIVWFAWDNLSRQWLPYALAEMHPAALEPDGALSFYIDKSPQSLHDARKGLFVELTGEAALDYTPEALVDALAASKTGSKDDRERCKAILAAALAEDGTPAPARCISGHEAQLYCEARGMRLPTRKEWSAALADTAVSSAPIRAASRSSQPLTRGSFAEWTRDVDADDEASFEVVGWPEDEAETRVEIAPEDASPRVGFRCAYTFGD